MSLHIPNHGYQFVFRLLIAFCLFLIPSGACPDSGPYRGIVRIWAESDELLALHYHHWDEYDSLANLCEDIQRLDRFFGEENKMAFVEVWNKKTNKRMWHIPCTAFNHLWVSPDSKYIVGISYVKLFNPYQLVIFNRSGKIVFRKHIGDGLAKFNTQEIQAFWQKYPEDKKYLESRTRIVAGTYYVDFLIYGMPDFISKGAWQDLKDKAVANPEIPAVSESVTNFVDWYDQLDPGLRILEGAGKTYLDFWGVYDPSLPYKPQTKHRVTLTIF